MSQILSIPQMLDLETRVFASGVEPWDAMESVGRGMARVIVKRFPEPGICYLFAGKGNNGGDAWVVARCLVEVGWVVLPEVLFSDDELTPLARRAKSMHEEQQRIYAQSYFGEFLPGAKIVIDGLLGIGSRGEPLAPISGAIATIKALRERGATVFALDMPSGLGSVTRVVADYTLTAGFAKDVLVADEATAAVGRLHVIEIEAFSAQLEPTDAAVVNTPTTLRSFVLPRDFDTHKGQCGRLAIFAGGLGTVGAAVLSATGALRAGAGLVTLYVPDVVYSIAATKAPPEVMVLPWSALDDFLNTKWNALALGPGIHPDEAHLLEEWLVRTDIPKVLDAGVLTYLAKRPELQIRMNCETLLTPHPGEMERLLPREGKTRAAWAKSFLEERNCTLLLKGARTVIAAPGQPPSYNPTGHPGMATGGMGDVLTGVCGALLAIELSPDEAGRVGAWICGRAAEMAIERQGRSQESLVPSDLFDFFGAAFDELRRG